MSRYYLDTSALLPFYRREPASDVVDAFLRKHRGSLIVSALARTEFASALARWVRTDELDEQGAARVESAFHEDVAARRFRTTPLEADHYDRALHWLLLRTTPLRTLDALHLACAEAAGAVLVTLDAAFAASAKQLGLRAIRPG